MAKDLFDLPDPPKHRAFDGATYSPTHDHIRLKGQLSKVFDLIKDGQWRTLADIRRTIESGSEAAISARLRDLRKEKYGNHTVSRLRFTANGLFRYRLIINTKAA